MFAKPQFNFCHIYQGEARGNENIGLTAIQNIFAREHNRLAKLLKGLPTWRNVDDSVIFEEARRINTAQYQHIVYTELLPILIGLYPNFAEAISSTVDTIYG